MLFSSTRISGGGSGGGSLGTVTSINGVDSVQTTPNPITNTGIISLVGDVISPNPSQYYGSDGSATRGWYDLPGAGATIGGSIADTQIAFGTGPDTIGGSGRLTWTPSPSTLTPAVLSVLDGSSNPFLVVDPTIKKVSLGDSSTAFSGTKIIIDDSAPIITAGIGTKNYVSIETNVQSFGDSTGNAFMQTVPVTSSLSAFVGGVQALKLDGSALQYSLGNLSGTLVTVDDTANIITLNATSGVVIPNADVEISGLSYTFPSSFGAAGTVLTDTTGSGNLLWTSPTSGVSASNDVVGITNAGVATLVSFTVPGGPGAAHQFSTSVYVNIASITGYNLTAQVSWTDENGGSHVQNFFNPGGGVAMSTAQFFPFAPLTIRARGGTGVTVSINLIGGAGSITYDAGGYINQIN